MHTHEKLPVLTSGHIMREFLDWVNWDEKIYPKCGWYHFLDWDPGLLTWRKNPEQQTFVSLLPDYGHNGTRCLMYLPLWLPPHDGLYPPSFSPSFPSFPPFLPASLFPSLLPSSFLQAIALVRCFTTAVGKETKRLCLAVYSVWVGQVLVDIEWAAVRRSRWERKCVFVCGDCCGASHLP